MYPCFPPISTQMWSSIIITTCMYLSVYSIPPFSCLLRLGWQNFWFDLIFSLLHTCSTQLNTIKKRFNYATSPFMTMIFKWILVTAQQSYCISFSCILFNNYIIPFPSTLTPSPFLLISVVILPCVSSENTNRKDLKVSYTISTHYSLYDHIFCLFSHCNGWTVCIATKGHFLHF